MNDEDGLILALLCGFYEKKRGLIRERFLKGDEERRARTAFAKLLRSTRPLSREFRLILAALFDTEPDTHPGVARQLAFVFRKRGQPPDFAANTQIAEYVRERVYSGKRVTQAIDDTVANFDRDESTVRKLWNRYKPIFKIMYGEIPKKKERNRVFRSLD